jgi:CHAD domain-containing protein
MARARPIPDLSAGQPYASAAAKAVSVRAAELQEHSRGVLDMEDIERLHDMRVATRRLRAALEIFEPCFPPKRFKEALREVKGMADALGERRDRDVSIATLTQFAAEIPPEERRGVESLIGSMRGEQQEANRTLKKAVSEERLRALGVKVAGLVAAAERRGA